MRKHKAGKLVELSHGLSALFLKKGDYSWVRCISF